MMKKLFQQIIEFFLAKYDQHDYILYQKARIFFFLTLSLLVLLTLAIFYTIPLHGEMPPGIIIPEAAGFVIMASTLILLRRGNFNIAAHILILAGMITCWTVMFFDPSGPVGRLDTIAFILSLVALPSLLVNRVRWPILFYAFLNIAMMFFYMWLQYDSLLITKTEAIDWLGDTSTALIFITVIGWNIHSINQRALKRVEKEVKDRLKKEEQLRHKNIQLEAAIKEIEASNEEFEALNEELIASQMDLAESEEKFKLIAEKSQIGIIIAQDEKLSYVNQAVAEISGFSIDEMMAWNPGGYSTLIPKDRLKSFMENARQRQQGNIPGGLNEEIRMISKGGDIKWIEINSTTVHFQGRSAELVALIDITDRKKTQELLMQTEKMITIGGLSAGMAHEINNPLGIILHGIQNTLRRLDSDSSKNREKAEQHGIDLDKLKGFLVEQNIFSYLTGIQDAGNRASKIVSSMLQFSRSNSGIPESVRIELIIDKALSIAEKDYDLQKSYDFKKITIEKDYTPDLPKITCIETEIEQVLLNLFKNAAQAMSGINQKSYKPVISITTTLLEESIELQITDNGPGMPEATLNHIFDPFFTTKEIGTGTGLGLSVTFFIITVHHNGLIRASSIPGRGTEFTITLPINE